MRALNTQVKKFWDRRQKLLFILEIGRVRDKPIVSMDHWGSLVGSHRWPINPCWFQ